MLWEPYIIGAHRAKNRLVRSATNDHLGNLDGSLSEEQFDLYETLAESGLGTIITGHFGVDAECRADKCQPLVTEDRFLPGLREMAARVHAHDALLCGQLSQAGLSGYARPFDINAAGHGQLAAIRDKFAAGAERLARAGFDGVQIHLAHGYFLANVLDDTVNLRTDEYGGSDENRFRLVREITEAVRAAVPTDFGLIVKLSATNVALAPYDGHLLYYAGKLKKLGVEAIELSGSDFARRDRAEHAYYLREALLVKERVDIPVILVGGMDKMSVMESALEQGIDMVSLCRAFICEPDFARKLRGGAERSECLHCWKCFRLYKTAYKNCPFLPESQRLKELYGE